MGFIILIIVGALIGWVASLIMNTDAQQGAFANILIGIVGSLVGAWLFGSVFGIPSAQFAGSPSIAGIFWGVLGALVIIGVLRMVRVLR